MELTDSSSPAINAFNNSTGSFLASSLTKGTNLGSPVQQIFVTGAVAHILISANEYYYSSSLLSVDGYGNTTNGITTFKSNTAMSKELYGQLWGLWAFATANTTSTTKIMAQTWDNMIFVGEKVNAGTAFRHALSSDVLGALVSTGLTPASFSASAVNASNKAIIKGPTGG